MNNYKPQIGDTVYIDSELYLNHGCDDLRGGQTDIIDVIEDEFGLWVEVAVRPGERYLWAYLADKQALLRDKFGDLKAQDNPDNREQFN
jgi:hypothetical protein